METTPDTHRTAQLAQAAQLATRAQVLVTAGDEPGASRLLRAAAEAYERGCDGASALDCWARAITLAGGVSSHLHRDRALAALRLEHEDAASLWQQVESECVLAGDVEGRARARYVRCSIGSAELLVQLRERREELATEGGWGRRTAAYLCLQLGEWERALDLDSEALELALAAGDRLLEGLCWWGLSVSRLMTGDRMLSDASLDSAIAILEEVRLHRWLVAARLERSESLLEQLRTDEAIEELRAIGRHVVAHDLADVRPRVVARTGRALAHAGRCADARRLSRIALELLRDDASAVTNHGALVAPLVLDAMLQCGLGAQSADAAIVEAALDRTRHVVDEDLAGHMAGELQLSLLRRAVLHGDHTTCAAVAAPLLEADPVARAIGATWLARCAAISGVDGISLAVRLVDGVDIAGAIGVLARRTVEAIAAGDDRLLQEVAREWAEAQRAPDAAWTAIAAGALRARRGDDGDGPTARELCVAGIARLLGCGAGDAAIRAHHLLGGTVSLELPRALVLAAIDAPVLDGLSVGERSLLLSCCTPLRLSAGERVEAALLGASAVLVAGGQLRALREAGDDKSFTTALIDPGEWIGGAIEHGSWQPGIEVEAISTTELVVVPLALVRVLATHGAAAATISELRAQLGEAHEAAGRMAFWTSDRRLARLLVDLDQRYGSGAPDEPGVRVIDRPLSQALLASMIGARREAVNAALRALAKDGIVEVRQRRVHVLDGARLAEIAGD